MGEEKSKRKFKLSKKVKKLICLFIVLVFSFLIATQWISVLYIKSTSMSPTLESGQIMILLKKKEVKQGDVVAFWKNDKLFVKRAIAKQGQYVDIDIKGKVSVDHKVIKEDYVDHLSLGNSNISMPHQVDQSHWFCLGDNRDSSIDSRNTIIGDVSENQIEGVVVFRIWPLNKFRIIQ